MERPLTKQVQNEISPALSAWLTDETNLLTTSEKNFAYQLQSMGFPLSCISRTIRRLGLDEKEVIMFDLIDKMFEFGAVHLNHH